MPDDAVDRIDNITAEDMRDIMYGNIQTMIEGNIPKNVSFLYYMPPIPFGPELASFMDIGPKAKAWREEGFTVNDMMRAAINFAAIVDHIPTLNPSDDEGSDIVDINTLIASGHTLSKAYESILNNCRVFDNKRSDEDKEKLEKLRALLYVDNEEPTAPPPSDGDDDVDALLNDPLGSEFDDLLGDDDDDLLSGFDDDGDLNLDDLFADGASTGDFVSDPNTISTPTKAMQLYEALMAHYEQTVLDVLDKLAKVKPNDPNAGVRVRLLKNKIRAAAQRWEAQGRRTKIRSIIARIEQLSQGGMPEYLAELRARFEGAEIIASIFADEELGVGLVAETAHYTALRPNGILSAPSLLKVKISSSDSSSWTKFKKKSTSASFKAPSIGIFGGASGNVSKFDQNRQSEFFKNDFEISFEIVQGLVDRTAWFAKDFVECRAYTTVDPRTGTPLDPIQQITLLSDGNVPPEEGIVPMIPMTCYFIRNLKIRSKAFASLSESDRDMVSGGGGVSIFGFGAKASHSNETIETRYSRAATEGTITANGTYLVAMSSVYLKQAPNPDFDTFPKDQWI